MVEHSLPYYPKLNPIEKIQTQVKNYVGTHNINLKFADMWKMQKKIKTIGPEQWTAVCQCAEKIDKYLKRKLFATFRNFSQVQEPIIEINTGVLTDDKSDFSSEENDNDLKCVKL